MFLTITQDQSERIFENHYRIPLLGWAYVVDERHRLLVSLGCATESTAGGSQKCQDADSPLTEVSCIRDDSRFRDSVFGTSGPAMWQGLTKNVPAGGWITQIGFSVFQ